MASEIFRCKSKSLPGTQYAELNRAARKAFHEIEKKTKRQAYIRSPYFNKEKVFIKSLWDHLVTKGMRDKARRVKLFACAIELIRENKAIKPEKVFESKREEIYRFAGISADERKFAVQIRHDVKTGNRYFTSVFPE